MNKFLVMNSVPKTVMSLPRVLPCDPGYVQRIKLLSNGGTVIKLDTIGNENFTEMKAQAELLLDAFFSKSKIKLITNTCREPDYGFAKFEVIV